MGENDTEFSVKGLGAFKAPIQFLVQTFAPAKVARSQAMIALAKSATEKISQGLALSPEEQAVFQSVMAPEIAKHERVARQVRLALEIAAEPKALPAPIPQPPTGETSEAWVDHWRFGAGFASDPHIEETWARILAGEIRSPGRFSLQTLSVLHELDQKTAEKFVALTDFALDGWAVPEWSKFSAVYDSIDLPYKWFLRFDAARLISFTASSMMRDQVALSELTAAGCAWRMGGSPALLPIHVLTPAGEELASIADRPINPLPARALGAWFKKNYPTVEVKRDGNFVPWDPTTTDLGDPSI